MNVDTTDVRLQRRAADLAGIRELADYLESHPEIPMPCLMFNLYADNAQQLIALRRLMEVSEKYDAGDIIYFTKTFSGDVRLDLNINKEKTCEKVKVGTKTIPAEPAKPERVEDVFEWKCSPLLAATKEPAPA